MIKLSDRLELIANLIQKDETMADIGTDHGFLPVALWERGICRKIILSDVNRGPLEKAKENIELSNPGAELDLRLGNGLKTLSSGEVTTVVLAGMGGVLMTEIPGEDFAKSKSFEKIILQPRNGQSKLRYWLSVNGFEILKEELVKEGKSICEIIVIKPAEKAFAGNASAEKADWQEIQFELPEQKNLGDTLLLKEFVQNKIRIDKKIIDEIVTGKNENSSLNRQKIARSKERIIFMEEYLKDAGE